MNKHFSRNLLASSIFFATLTSQAYAQDTGSLTPSNGTQANNEQANVQTATSLTPASKDKTVQLQNVTVTAQRREEEVQKIPIAISVLNEVQLEHMQARDLKVLAFAVPNLIINNGDALSTSASIFLRAGGQDESLFTSDPAVGLYVDDVYIPRTNGAMLNLNDVERLEVLRGPQGTLYGRNSTGGAIRYVTRKPDGKDRLTANATLGNLGRRDLRISFGTKVGKIDVSGGVISLNRDGYVHDVTYDRLVNNRQTNAARLELATELTATTYARLSLDYLRDTSGPAIPSPFKFNPDGKEVPALGSVYNTGANLLGAQDLKQYGVALHTDTDFGSFSLRNILAAGGMNQLLNVDFDGTDKTTYHLFQNLKERRYSYEAQLTSQVEGPFSWVGGFFAFRETNSQPTRSDIFVRGSTNYISQQDHSYALYWQGTYTFTDRLSLIGGTRYSWEHKDFQVVSVKANGSPNFTAKRGQTWTHPDWKIGLNYNFTENVMGYVSDTTGFQSGGYNGRASTAAAAVAVSPERVNSAEIGVKSTLFDGRMHLNADYYYANWAAMQLSGTLPTGEFRLTNATGALIQGFEVEGQVQLSQRWRADVGLSTINAKYRNYSAANIPTFAGKDLKKAPRFQWNLSSTYIQPLASADVAWSLQLKYTDFYFGAQNNDPVAKTGAHLDAAARISYEPRSANWSAALWGKNLTNNHLAGGLNIPSLGMVIRTAVEPRTYGIDFTYRFF